MSNNYHNLPKRCCLFHHFNSTLSQSSSLTYLVMVLCLCFLFSFRLPRVNCSIGIEINKTHLFAPFTFFVYSFLGREKGGFLRVIMTDSDINWQFKLGRRSKRLFLHHNVGWLALPALLKTPVNFFQSTSAIGSKCGQNFLIRPYSEESCGTSLALLFLLPLTCSFYYYQGSRNWLGCVSNCFIFQSQIVSEEVQSLSPLTVGGMVAW